MFNENRPVLQIPKTLSERMWNVVGATLFIASIIYIFLKWGSLPSEVPAHFDGAGVVNRYGSKFEMLILPIIGLFTWVLLEVLERKPHIHNYPARLNASNAEAFYKSSRKLLNMVKNTCLILFAIISIQTVRIGLGEITSLGVWFLPMLLVVMFLPIGLVIIQQMRIK